MKKGFVQQQQLVDDDNGFMTNEDLIMMLNFNLKHPNFNLLRIHQSRVYARLLGVNEPTHDQRSLYLLAHKRIKLKTRSSTTMKTIQCIEWRYSPSRFRSCLISSLAIWNVVWVLFNLALEVKDYLDNTYKDWPFQVPAYSLTLIMLLADCVWWFYLVSRQPNDTTAVEDGGRRKLGSSCAPMWLVAGYAILFAMQIGMSIRWTVAWVSGSDKYGDADWGGSNSRDKALGWYMTITFIAAFLRSRMYRSCSNDVAPKPTAGEGVVGGEEP